MKHNISFEVVRFIRIGFILLLVFLLISCDGGDSGGGGSSVTPASPPAAPAAPVIVPSLSYSSTTFNESLVNDGSVEGTLRIEISDDTFAADVVSGDKYQLTNIPAGLTATLKYISNTTLTLTFEDTPADNHLSTDSLSNIGITFLNGAFVNSATASSVTGYNYTTIGISYIDEAPSYYLTYSALEFNEAAANDGSIKIPKTITITLNSDATVDTFSGDVLSYVTAANVPAGLSADFNRDSDTQLTLTLNGNASFHGDSADISNLRVVFSDGAFNL